jgi:hypothetical protein
MSSKSVSECYVYITLPGATEAVVAARFELGKNRADAPLGRLVYGMPAPIGGEGALSNAMWEKRL